MKLCYPEKERFKKNPRENFLVPLMQDARYKGYDATSYDVCHALMLALSFH